MPRGKRGKPPEDVPPPTETADVLPLVSVEPNIPLQRPNRYVFQGIHQRIYDDDVYELDAEGGLSSGKTTLALQKELDFLINCPGIWSFLFRYSGTDTDTKLKSAFEKVCARNEIFPKWNSKELAYEFESGSRASMFGLKSADHLSRYSKLRGLEVSRIYNDQSEELPSDVFLELPARMRQHQFRHQITLTPNPPHPNHWLCDHFPEDNRIKNRHMYSVSLYDNSHNLPEQTLRGLESSYPPEHAKHRVVILGKRGVNVMGVPVYENLFQRDLHSRPLVYDPTRPLFECVDYGKTNPAWVVAQQTEWGGMHFLAGLIGRQMFLEDFLPVVMQYRGLWFPNALRFKTCCTVSSYAKLQQFSVAKHFSEVGLRPIWNEHSNDPDIVLSLIERMGSYMRRRLADGSEAFGINKSEEHWLEVSREGIKFSPFLPQAFDGGYCWAATDVSVGRNEMRQPQIDGWFEHGMRCVEAIELNFGMASERDKALEALAKRNRLNEPRLVSHQPQGWME